MRLAVTLFLFIFIISCSSENTYKNKMKPDVEYLSSDQLEGRSTGSKGANLAGKYIKNRRNAIC